MTDTVTVHNRPATVDQRYSDVARVRYQDTNTVAYVPLSEVPA